MNPRILAILVSVTLASVLAACGKESTGNADETGANATLKVALIPPASGAFAEYGTDAVKGWQLAVDEANAAGGVDGHKIELIIKDTEADPATTLRVAREVTTKDGATIIGAVMTSPEHAALNAQLEGLGALSFSSLGKDDALRGEQCSPNTFHIVQSAGMDINNLAGSIATLPGNKWAVLGVDYATGHTAATAFAEAAEEAGKQIVSTQFAPLNTTDFGTYITKIKESGADSVFAIEYGADAIAFIQQAEQFDLQSQIKTVLGFNMVSELQFPALGDSVLGYYDNVAYDQTADNPMNKEFVAAYEAEFDTEPYWVPAGSYLAAQTLFAGIEEAGSIEIEGIKSALEGFTFDSIYGEVTLRAEDHQLLMPSYLGRVEKDGEDLGFEILQSTSADQTTPSADPACEL